MKFKVLLLSTLSVVFAQTAVQAVHYSSTYYDSADSDDDDGTEPLYRTRTIRVTYEAQGAPRAGIEQLEAAAVGPRILERP